MIHNCYHLRGIDCIDILKLKIIFKKYLTFAAELFLSKWFNFDDGSMSGSQFWVGLCDTNVSIPNRKYRSKLKLIVLISVFLLFLKLIVLAIVFWGPESYPGLANSTTGQGRIVLWTPYFERYDYSRIGLDSSTFDSCPHKCQVISSNRRVSILQDQDAVIIHLRDVTHMMELPTVRSKDQLWVFLLQECPKHSDVDLRNFNYAFNMTMTYRYDGDIFHPYGLIRRRDKKQHSEWKEGKKTLTARPNLAAIVVSHCNTSSNRESYLADLQEFTPVDVYGQCGKFKCAKGQIMMCKTAHCRVQKSLQCYQHLSKSYKFYLAFENSLCVDYVSEKFFFALMSDLVPVVYGGADYLQVAPSHSYINARDFKSPRELAIYLQYLNTHHEEYLRYFDWKSNYVVDITQRQGWCDLCGMVTQRKRREAYASIDLWWNYAPQVQDLKSNTQNSSENTRQSVCEKRPTYQHNGWRDAEFNRLD